MTAVRVETVEPNHGVACAIADSGSERQLQVCCQVCYIPDCWEWQMGSCRFVAHIEEPEQAAPLTVPTTIPRWQARTVLFSINVNHHFEPFERMVEIADCSVDCVMSILQTFTRFVSFSTCTGSFKQEGILERCTFGHQEWDNLNLVWLK